MTLQITPRGFCGPTYFYHLAMWIDKCHRPSSLFCGALVEFHINISIHSECVLLDRQWTWLTFFGALIYSPQIQALPCAQRSHKSIHIAFTLCPIIHSLSPLSIFASSTHYFLSPRTIFLIFNFLIKKTQFALQNFN